MPNSIEDLARYLHKQQLAEVEKWGLFYPFVGIIERCSYCIKRSWNQFVWVYQRIIRKHHTSDNDLHCLDLHISRILLPKLETFRIHIADVTQHDKKEDWLNILDEIIYAFKWNIHANWQKNPTKERDFYLYHFGMDDQNLDYMNYFDSEIVKIAAKRAQKGFELFGKYFTHLWNF